MRARPIRATDRDVLRGVLVSRVLRTQYGSDGTVTGARTSALDAAEHGADPATSIGSESLTAASVGTPAQRAVAGRLAGARSQRGTPSLP